MYQDFLKILSWIIWYLLVSSWYQLEYMIYPISITWTMSWIFKPRYSAAGPLLQINWLFHRIVLVLVIGGRDYIIPQKAIYSWYISGIYCQLGDYMLPTTFYKNLKKINLDCFELMAPPAKKQHKAFGCVFPEENKGDVRCQALRIHPLNRWFLETSRYRIPSSWGLMFDWYVSRGQVPFLGGVWMSRGDEERSSWDFYQLFQSFAYMTSLGIGHDRQNQPSNWTLLICIFLQNMCNSKDI